MICSGWRPSHTRVGASGGERHDGTTGGRGTRRRVARPTLEDHPPPAAGGACCRGGLAWSPRRVRGTGSAVGGRARGREPGAGAARRGGDGQDGAVVLR